MKFKLNSGHRKNNEKKTVKKFAFFPKIVDNGKTLVWLEFYFKEYRWQIWNNPTINNEWKLVKTYSNAGRIEMIEKEIYG